MIGIEPRFQFGECGLRTGRGPPAAAVAKPMVPKATTGTKLRLLT